MQPSEEVRTMVGEEGIEPPKPKRLVYSQGALTSSALARDSLCLELVLNFLHHCIVR